MSSLRRQFGFWRSLGRMQLRDLTAPEVVFGVVIGAGLALLLSHVVPVHHVLRSPGITCPSQARWWA